MKRRLLVGISALAFGVALGGGTASADTVGVPGEPNCFGTRTSHAASSHGLTPPERMAILNTFLPFEVTVRDVMAHVRMCLPPPTQ